MTTNKAHLECSGWALLCLSCNVVLGFAALANDRAGKRQQGARQQGEWT